ncbi:MAG: glutamate 5-kinase [Candidatus Gastranaerophilales bacterium]|nr:glutamate 5-kinase [Candidatus Gastranaerophilales bacterium]
MIENSKRIVFKFGTNILRNEDGEISLSHLYSFIEDITHMYKQGKEILIVTSGAVGLGAKKLKIDTSTSTTLKQAAASVGQPLLMGIWQDGFEKYGITTAQILLTEEDFANRKKYLSLRLTLSKLLENKVIPIINQNDAVSPSELEHVCFSDNDKLSSIVASKLDADLLVMVSDINGLYDKNPKEFDDAKLIKKVDKVTSKIEALASGATLGGRGGMITKLTAAKVVTSSGLYAKIVNGKTPNIIRKVFDDEIGTTFLPNNNLSHKKRWIAYATNIMGALKVNDGAKEAIIKNQKSLLSVGIVEVKGKFKRGEIISLIDENNNEFARGISSYNSDDIDKIKGCHSDKISQILGYKFDDDVVIKDNLVII